MRKHEKKREGWGRLVVAVIMAVLILSIIFVGGFITAKLSNLKIKQIDKSQLGINNSVYSNLEEDLTKKEFQEVKKVVLFGIDTQSKNDGQEEEGFLGRSDTIMIASINPKYKSLKLISIPRDTYAEIEGYGKMKINHAYAFGEEQLAIKTINSNFGLDITEYATVDFSGLVHVINELGGIQLEISKGEMQFINGLSETAYEISGNSKKKLTSYGTVNLDGEQALTHSRNRTIGDDFTRAERQREVLEAVLRKMITMDVDKISNALDIFAKEVTTNINVADYIGTITELVLNKDAYLNNIISVQVPSKEYATGQYIKGIYYFVPSDTERMKQDMIDYLYKR